MHIDEQVRIMEGQLRCFDGLLDKMAYLTKFFDPDPEFTKEARDIVRSNVVRSMEKRNAN
jgi:hypothetical protein